MIVDERPPAMRYSLYQSCSVGGAYSTLAHTRAHTRAHSRTLTHPLHSAGNFAAMLYPDSCVAWKEVCEGPDGLFCVESTKLSSSSLVTWLPADPRIRHLLDLHCVFRPFLIKLVDGIVVEGADVGSAIDAL